ncbi:MAG: hypothetical protein SNJ55_11430 [Chloroherpetonaceae bacterium]
MMRIQRFFSGLLLATSLLAISIFTSGCYTQFATTNSIARISSPSEVDVEELVENGGSVTINNYYDNYYAHFLRPTIYGFAGTWGWYDPFWGYPLWYTPVFAPVAYYGWGGGWGWNRWGVWNPYFPPVWGGAVASTSPVGTRRTGIGRTRTIGIENPIFPTNSSSLRYGSSSEGGTIAPNSRRQRTGTTTAPADASRRNSRTRAFERNTDGEKNGRLKGSSESTRRQSSGERRTPSYSAPSQRSSPSPSVPSRSSGSSSGSSSSGSSGRRQR